MTHISPRPTLHSTSYHYIHFPSHSSSIPFPSPHLAGPHPTSLYFFTYQSPTPVLGNTRLPPYSKIPSLHFTSLIIFQPFLLEILDLLPTPKSLHFTSLHFTYHLSALSPGNTRSPPYSKIPSLHFTSLIIFQPFLLEILDLLPTPKSLHFTSLHFTYHISSPFPGNTRFPLHFELSSLHFSSLHFTYFFSTPVLRNTRFPPHFEIPSLPFTSLHFTSLNTFLPFSLYILDFPAIQNPFTSLITFQSLFLQILYFLLTSNSLHFTSLHFTNHFPNPLPKWGKVWKGKSQKHS